MLHFFVVVVFVPIVSLSRPLYFVLSFPNQTVWNHDQCGWYVPCGRIIALALDRDA